jgi:hypothetical protein
MMRRDNFHEIWYFFHIVTMRYRLGITSFFKEIEQVKEVPGGHVPSWQTGNEEAFYRSFPVAIY